MRNDSGKGWQRFMRIGSAGLIKGRSVSAFLVGILYHRIGLSVAVSMVGNLFRPNNCFTSFNKEECLQSLRISPIED